MAGRNHVYIDLIADISGCSHGIQNAPQTQVVCCIAWIGRPGQRHAQGSSYVDLIMEAKLGLKDRPYNLDKEWVILEEMKGML